MARLLVAEDDRLMRWSLEKYLSHGGHAVHSVDSGDEAIEAAKCDEYRVVITDYALPGSDGLHVLQSIKARNPQVHVIVITGQAAPQRERLARDTGAFEFLEKPFQLVALKQAVERALVTPERRKGPRSCCGKCVWGMPCDHWSR